MPNTKLAPTNLVMPLKLREEINRQCNLAEAAARTDTVEFKIDTAAGDTSQNNPQDFIAWPGMAMVAVSTGKHYKNGRRYKIKEIKDTVVALQGEHEFELKRSEFVRCMRLSYTLNYQGSQGLTVDGLLALHNTDHYYFTSKMLYVGVSRATGSNKLIVY